jgi:uncharacterized membrane protein YhaH (DUF805 family)
MSTPSLPQAPAGWYADPTDGNQLRYWDGSAWTAGPPQTYDTVAPAYLPQPGLPTAPPMAFADGVKSALNNYADFSGRARRAEYWWYTLFVFIVYLAVAIVDAAVGANSILALVVALGLFVPGLAVSVRRLHDTNRSGWFILIALIPFGSIVLLVFECQDSDRGPNLYGNSPKYA